MSFVPTSPTRAPRVCRHGTELREGLIITLNMKKTRPISFLPAACALVCWGALPSVGAASILFVSDNGLKGTQVGSDGVTRGAFYPANSTNGTPYVDQGFVDLLVAAGHTVVRYNPASQVMSLDDVPMINSFDLVIAGSALNSGPFNLNARGAKWNTMVTAPMIYTKSTLVRRDRTGFLLDNKEFDCAADASTTASVHGCCAGASVPRSHDSSARISARITLTSWSLTPPRAWRRRPASRA